MGRDEGKKRLAYLRELGEVGREDEDVRRGLEVEEIEMGEIEVDVLNELIGDGVDRVEPVEAKKRNASSSSQLFVHLYASMFLGRNTRQILKKMTRQTHVL